MTPRRARLALSLFLLLAAAVAHNALFRQTRPAGGGIATQARSAAAPVPRVPQATTRPAEAPAERAAAPAKEHADKRPVRIGRFKPDWAASDIPSDPAAVQLPDVARVDTVRAVQRELRQRGYGPLVSDGSVRPATRAAIMAFEYDHGLPLTGQVSEALLRRILFGGSPTADPGAGRVRTAEAEALVRSVQQSLTALGYRPGPPDGQLSEDTIRAIREFEMDKGLVPKGRISAEVLGQLTGAGTPKLSRR